MEDKTDFSSAEKAFKRLLKLCFVLRGQNGCSWDREQTPMSMRGNLAEECFEAIDAITDSSPSHAREELGDLIFNALMISYMYEQNGDFSVEQVLNDVCDKLIRRHPHVFGKESQAYSEMLKSFAEKNNKDSKEGQNQQNSEKVMKQWDSIKENLEGRKKNALLDQVPKAFPPLMKASKYMKKVSKKGFDWKNADDCLEKLKEELSELEEARKDYEKAKEIFEKENSGDTALPFTVHGGDEKLNSAFSHLEEETGDAFLALTKYSCKLGVDPELALEKADLKFYRRFSYVEKVLEGEGGLENSTSERMIEVWNEAKKWEKI